MANALRLRTFDTSTEEGRALERNRRASWSTATNILARTLEAALTLVSVPLSIGYLGKEQYGLWVAVSSLLAWAALADFGLLRGLQNSLSDAHGRDDRAAAGQAMSTAFYAIVGLALGLGGLFVAAMPLIPWGSLLHVRGGSLEVRPVLAAVVAVFLLQFPLKTVRQAYAAYQRGYVANLFSIAGSVLSLGVLLAVIRLRLGLPWLILASGGVSAAVSLLTLVHLAREMPFLWPRLGLIDRASLRGLALVSAPLLLFDVGSLMINEIQLLILAREQGMGAAAEYSVYLKVMSIPLFLVNVLDAPYVAMYREALVRGDQRWFRERFGLLQRVKLAASLALAALLVPGGDLLSGALSGQGVRLGPGLWALAGLNMIVGCWNGSYNNLFFATERTWTLVRIILANGVVTLGLTLLLSATHGLAGVLVASTAFSLLVSGWLLPVLSRDLFRRLPRPGRWPPGAMDSDGQRWTAPFTRGQRVPGVFCGEQRGASQACVVRQRRLHETGRSNPMNNRPMINFSRATFFAAVAFAAVMAGASQASAGTSPISTESKSISKTFGKDDFSATVGASSKVTAFDYAEVCSWVNGELTDSYKAAGLQPEVVNILVKPMRDAYCKHAGRYYGTGAEAGARAKIMGHSIDVAGISGWATSDYNRYEAGYRFTVGGNAVSTLRVISSVDQDFSMPMTLVSGTRKFMVGPVPVYIEGEAVGRIGVRLQAQFGNSQVEGTLTPHAGIDASFGCGVGVDFAKAGIEGELNLVTLHIPAAGFINWGNAPQITYGGDITAKITALDGSIKLGAWLFGEEVGSVDIFSWEGFEYNLTKSPLYAFSGSFSM